MLIFVRHWVLQQVLRFISFVVLFYFRILFYSIKNMWGMDEYFWLFQ